MIHTKPRQDTRAALLFATIFVVPALSACGADRLPPTDARPVACPTEQQTLKTPCTGLDECTRGSAPNCDPVEFCEHCLAQASTEACEAGQCRALPVAAEEKGTLKVVFVWSAFRTAKSMAQASLVPTTADGATLTCAGLLARKDYANNRTLNAVISNFRPMPGDDTAVSFISADPGPDRLYFVVLTSELQGKGNVLARGCAEHISVHRGAEPVLVPVTLVKEP